jgi:exodeoxyribonuclease-5
MSDIILSIEQSEAVRKAVYWFKDRAGDQLFEIAGYAGVGKSTVVKYLIQALDLNQDDVVFLAFTGKAALVLTRKGNPAMTIHRFCYDPKLSSYKDPITGVPKTKVGGFMPKLAPEKPVKLIVVDEVSMVSAKLLHDLRKFNIKMLVLGDPGQLPPVMGKGNGLLVRPDVFLERIHRQAEDSPIIWAATRARQGLPLPVGTHGEKVHVISRYQITTEHLLGVDQVIACTHRNRKLYNAKVREFLGFDTPLPLAGEKLINKSNRWETFSSKSMTPLVNGITVRMIDAPRDVMRNSRKFHANLELEHDADDRYLYEGVNLDFFEPMPGREPDTDADLVHLDFAYAITCHAAQGSEWAKGLYVSDTWGDEGDRRKLNYTGITRFADELIIAL